MTGDAQLGPATPGRGARCSTWRNREKGLDPIGKARAGPAQRPRCLVSEGRIVRPGGRATMRKAPIRHLLATGALAAAILTIAVGAGAERERPLASM